MNEAILKGIEGEGPHKRGEAIGDGHSSKRIWHKDHYVEEYRKVFADALGMDPDDLPLEFMVHHIDNDRMNNDIDNLALCTRKAHERLENMLYPEKYNHTRDDKPHDTANGHREGK